MPEADVMELLVDAFGVIVPLRVRGAELAAAVREAWRDALTDREAGVSPLTVAIGTNTPAQVRGADIEEVLHHLSPAVTTHALVARAGQLMMLHAAALADPRTGATAVLVAASGTGKTTASRTLGKRFIYLSDETAAITH